MLALEQYSFICLRRDIYWIVFWYLMNQTKFWGFILKKGHSGSKSRRDNNRCIQRPFFNPWLSFGPHLDPQPRGIWIWWNKTNLWNQVQYQNRCVTVGFASELMGHGWLLCIRLSFGLILLQNFRYKLL